MTGREGFQVGASREAVGSKAAVTLGVAAALLIAGALACEQAEELDASPGGHGGSLAVGGANSAGGDAVGGSSGDRVVVPPEAPECAGEDPSFIEITVRGSEGSRALDGHVVGQGLGLPAGVSDLPRGADSPDDVGWLQFEGTARLDAGADAGGAPLWTILGPREIAEMPAPVGELLHVRQERPPAPFYLSQHFEIIVTLGERVVLFQQVTQYNDKLGNREGFLLELGAPICQRATQMARNGAPCFYDYYHALEVTVPSGASATLALGEARTVGAYRLLHGSTNRLSGPATSFNQGGGECNDIKALPSQFTAILLPGAP